MIRQLRALILAALAFGPGVAGAQASVARAASACTYDTCALRVEPGILSAPRLLRGRAGVDVGRLGAFGGGVDTLLAGPDLAVLHAHRYQRDIRAANTLGLLSAVAFVVVVSRTDWFQHNGDDTDRAIGITGTALAVASIPFRVNALRNLSRSLWFYNAQFGR